MSLRALADERWLSRNQVDTADFTTDFPDVRQWIMFIRALVQHQAQRGLTKAKGSNDEAMLKKIFGVVQKFSSSSALQELKGRQWIDGGVVKAPHFPDVKQWIDTLNKLVQYQVEVDKEAELKATQDQVRCRGPHRRLAEVTNTDVGLYIKGDRGRAGERARCVSKDCRVEEVQVQVHTDEAQELYQIHAAIGGVFISFAGVKLGERSK